MEQTVNFVLDPFLGKVGKDKITGYKGIITTKLICLYGCAQYGIVSQVMEDNKRPDIQYFDEGRIEITGKGIRPEDVQSLNGNGAEHNYDLP